MFYSQFILAKKGPLGTIWIAAHLERKLRKNQVAETDIGVSVDSILFPEVPIALRLSGHLLLGVVRVYSRQVNYLFNDCSETLLKIKQAFQSTAVDLPPEATTAPFHSITLPETFDFDELELFPENEGAPLRPNGNFVDHHVTSREHITLQDSHDNNFVLGSSQFGLDERFGDGNCSSMGLDFDEEFLSGKTQAGGPSTSSRFSDDDDDEDPMDLDTGKGQIDMDEPHMSPGNQFGMSRIDLNEERGSPLFRLSQSEGANNHSQNSVFDEDRIAPVFGLEHENDHHNTSNLSPLLEPLDEPISNKVSDSAIFKSDTPNFHTYTPCTPDLNQEFCPPDETSTPAILEGNFELGKSQTPENSELNASVELHPDAFASTPDANASPMLGQATPSSPLIGQTPAPSSGQQMGNEDVSLLPMQMPDQSDSSLQTMKDSTDTFQGFHLHKDVSSENSAQPEPHLQVPSVESSQQAANLVPNQHVSSIEAIEQSNSIFQGFPVHSSIPADGTRDAEHVQNSLTTVPNAESHIQVSLSENNHSGSIPFQGFQSMQASSVGGVQQSFLSSNATQDLNSKFQGFSAVNSCSESNLQPSLTERSQFGLPILNTQSFGQQKRMQASQVENTQQSVSSLPTQTVGQSILSVRAPQDSTSSFQGFSVQKDLSTDSGRLGLTNLSAVSASGNNQFGSTFQGFPLHKDVPAESGRNAQTNLGALSQRVQPSIIGNAHPGVSLLSGQSLASAETAKDSSSSFQGFPLHKDVVAEASRDSLREGSHPVSPIRRPNDSPTSSFHNVPKPTLFQQGSVSPFQEAGFLSSPSKAPYIPTTFQQQPATSISPQNLGLPAAWGTTIHTSAPMQSVANSQVSTSQPIHMLPATSGSMLLRANDAALYMHNFDAARQASWHPAGQQPSPSTASSMASRMGPIETLRSAANPSREDPGMMLLQKNMLHDRIPGLEMAQAEMRRNMSHMQPFQPQLDQTPIPREETPFDQTRKSPSSSRSFEPLPGDDDVLASILGRKRSNVFKVATTPKENQVAKKPRVASKSLLRKRKIEMDPLAVLHGDVIRQQLEYTGDIRRDRKKAPCTRREVWSFEKEVQGQQNFDEPSLIGFATDLQNLYGEILGGIELKVSADIASSQKTPALDAGKTNQDNSLVNPAVNADLQNRGDSTAHVESSKNSAVTNEQSGPVLDTAANPDPEGSTWDSENEGDAYDCPGGFESDSDVEGLDRPQNDIPEGVEMTSSQTSVGEAGTATVESIAKEFNPDVQNDKGTEGIVVPVVTGTPPSHDGTDAEVSTETQAREGDTQLSVGHEQIPGPEKDTYDIQAREALPKDIVELGVPEKNMDISMLKNQDVLGELHQPESDNDKPVQPLQQICCADGENQEEIKVEGNITADAEETKMQEDQKTEEEKPDQVLEITDQEKSKEPIKIIDVDEMKIEDVDDHVITDAPEEKVDVASEHENSDFFGNDDNADFLADDADDEDIDYTDLCDDGSGDEQHEIQENSGWSLRTRNVGRYLKNIFEGMENNLKASEDQQQNQNRTLGLERLLAHKTKKEAARMFFETLVLKTRDYIQVEQKTPYEDIHLYPKSKLMKTSF